MTGLQLLAIVKQHRPDLPVFMISAYGDKETVATAPQCGFHRKATRYSDLIPAALPI